MFAATHSAEDLHAALPTPSAGELIIWQNALVLRELKEMRGKFTQPQYWPPKLT